MITEKLDNVLQKEETITVDANLDELDKYIEMLYDDHVERKADGAKNIMMLCLLPEGLEVMLNHGIPSFFINRITIGCAYKNIERRTKEKPRSYYLLAWNVSSNF